MKPISRYMGWLGGHDAQRPMGKFGQDAEVTPLLCSKDIFGFFMTTESQDLGLTSHLKDGAFWQFSFLQNPNKQQRRLTCSFIARPGTQCLFPLSQETEVMSVACSVPFQNDLSHCANTLGERCPTESYYISSEWKAVLWAQRHDARYKSPKGNMGFFAVHTG